MSKAKPTIIPASQTKLKSMWTAQKEDYMSDKPTKTIKKPSSPKSKIMLNKHNWIVTDYNNIHHLESSTNTNNPNQKSTSTDKTSTEKSLNITYPVLRLITNEVPGENMKFNNMDMCLIKNINEMCVYKDGQFEFINIHN